MKDSDRELQQPHKKVRRACNEKLVNSRIEPDQDPGELIFVLDECRQLLEGTRKTVHNEWYEDIFLQVHSAEYKRMQLIFYKKKKFGLDDIQHVAHTIYLDTLSHPSNSKPIGSRDIAMQAAEHTSSDVQYHCCKGVRHLIREYAILKGKEDRYGAHQHVQPQRNQRAPSHRRGAHRYGMGEMASRSGTRSTRRLRTVKRSAAFSSAPRLTTGGRIAPVTRATLPSSA